MDTPAAAVAALVDHLEGLSAGRAARRQAAAWGAADPLLAGYQSPAAVAAAIRSGRPDVQDTLISALVAQGDGLAVLTVVAGLSRRLGWIVSGWRRAGVPAGDLADMEADLVSECWAVVAGLAGGAVPPRPGMRLVQAAWDRIRTPRRRDQRRVGRQATAEVDSDHAPASAGLAVGEELAGIVVTEVRAGRLSVTGARLVYSTRVAGMSVDEAAARLGCSCQSVRTRRARAEHRLAGILADTAA